MKNKKLLVFFLIIGHLLMFIFIVPVIKKAFPDKKPYVDLSVKSDAIPEIVGVDKKPGTLHFAVATMWSIESTFSMYRKLSERLARDMGYKESLIIRPTYEALNKSIENGEIDVAFVCTGPFVYIVSSGKIKLLVNPVFKDGQLYHSLILAPYSGNINSVKDLWNKILGCSDPESFTGYLLPFVMMNEVGMNPDTFLKKIIFTGSHDRSISALDNGIVDAAAVHSIVWESAKREDPTLKNRLKEIWRSENYGPPPVIVSTGLSESFVDSLKNAFLNLDKDAEGKEILSSIGIEKFVPARDEEYISALKLYKNYEKMKKNE